MRQGHIVLGRSRGTRKTATNASILSFSGREWEKARCQDRDHRTSAIDRASEVCWSRGQDTHKVSATLCLWWMSWLLCLGDQRRGRRRYRRACVTCNAYSQNYFEDMPDDGTATFLHTLQMSIVGFSTALHSVGTRSKSSSFFVVLFVRGQAVREAKKLDCDVMSIRLGSCPCVYVFVYVCECSCSVCVHSRSFRCFMPTWRCMVCGVTRDDVEWPIGHSIGVFSHAPIECAALEH